MKFRPRYSLILFLGMSVLLASCGRNPSDRRATLREGIRPATASAVERIRQSPEEPEKVETVVTLPAENTKG
ncbi:MAG TPA: hypothetical protein VHS59_06330, partial [Bacillota bacterium]|nr:hypothetical protein [Bacillota bacterium]